MTKTCIDEKDLLATKLRLYESLRQESLQSMAQRNSILALGSGAIGILFLAGVNAATAATPSSFLAYVVFALMLPILAMLLAAMWLGEAARMSRAGRYMCSVEEDVNQLLLRAFSGSSITGLEHWLYWENWLREPGEASEKQAPDVLKSVVRRSNDLLAISGILSAPRTKQLGYPYIAVGMCFGACALGPALVLSVWVATNHFNVIGMSVALLLSGMMVCVILIVFANLLERAMRLP